MLRLFDSQTDLCPEHCETPRLKMFFVGSRNDEMPSEFGAMPCDARRSLSLGVAFLTLICTLSPTGAGSSGECATSVDGLQNQSCLVASDAIAVIRKKRKEFWAEMKQQGLEIKLKKLSKEEKAFGGLPKRNRSAMVLSSDAFYGRAIIKFPRRMMISVETCRNADLRRELNSFLFESKALSKFNITLEDSQHLLALAYPLLAERRDENTMYKDWFDAIEHDHLVALELTERQRSVLIGTTVEGAHEEMVANRDLIQFTASNLTYFKKWPITEREASWALSVIMRHARVVHPHQDERDRRAARMYLIPLVQLLHVHLHPEASLAISFQEEITLDENKREQEMVLQIARRDMAKGEEVFVWPGRLSNSEMTIRQGMSFPVNPVGIGRNVSQPQNWNDNPESRIRKEYAKANCSSLESFEMRLSAQGFPMPIFRKCFRISWFLVNGWYNPGYLNKLRDLTTWPPPKSYRHEDWLAWTQADQALNDVILDYCSYARQKLKDTINAKTADDFRKSTDRIDKLLWNLRGEESRTFKECITLAKKVKG